MDAIIDAPISLNDIRALRAEAAEAGDLAQVDLCDKVLFLDDGTAEYARARRLCEEAIKDARAQHQEACDAG
jgi:hypothetical protein